MEKKSKKEDLIPLMSEWCKVRK